MLKTVPSIVPASLGLRLLGNRFEHPAIEGLLLLGCIRMEACRIDFDTSESTGTSLRESMC